MARKIAVIGIGNLLLRDEGVGVHIINKLRGFQLPENVEVYDCGTGGLGILGLLEGFDKAIVVDAVKCAEEPGTVYRFKFNEKGTDNRLAKMISFHELDFVTAIEIGRKAYKSPSEMVMIGVEPKTIEIGLDLSLEVKRSIPKVIGLIFEEIRACGD